MRLLLGEPGSGKTTRVLEEVRRAGVSARVVVPTATMAEHLRNQLARAGAGVRPSSVVTLAGFVQEIVPEVKGADLADLTLLVGMVLEDRRPAEYAGLVGSPGFAPAVAQALEDLANAGCDSVQWEALGRFGVHAMGALSRVYEELEGELKTRGMVTRAGQMAAAARQLRDSGCAAERVWFDGFFQFTRGEVELIRALKDRAAVTVTLPEWEGAQASRDALRQMGFREERLHRLRPEPRVTLLAAPTREREVEEIALRILEEHTAGRAWHEVGVILRSAQPYGPLVETTIARLGIPARAHFAPRLSGHAVGRFYAALVDAVLSGWEGSRTLKALQAGAPDRLAYKVREALPFSGLDRMRQLGGADAVAGYEDLTEWATATATPVEWAQRLGGLSRFVAAPQPGGPVAPEALRAFRMRAAAMRSFAESVEQTAALLPEEPILLEGFWRLAMVGLDETSVRVEDPRRDVVHILDVVEARQWELPVVFVCGLVEGEFPRAAAPEALLREDVRIRLRQNGIPVKTRAEREVEETFLFRFAQTRATSETVLSWPQNDEKGQQVLRAFLLDHVSGTDARARSIAVRAADPVERAPRPALQSDDVLQGVRARHPRFRPTGLEVFLQCPFRFFASRTLGIPEPPGLPHERLDALVLGTLVHQVIADWHRGAGSMDELFEREWERVLSEKRIPPSHRVEVARVVMLRSLRFYQQDSRPRDGWKTEVEVPLELTVDGAEIRGRADRVDTSPAGECVVYDFKYSSNQGVKNKLKKLDDGELVQGGLYLEALRQAGRTPAGFFFAGVRGSTAWEGSDAKGAAEGFISTALEATKDAVFRISQGDISVRPGDEDACRYCAFLDACRIQESSWQVTKAQSESS